MEVFRRREPTRLSGWVPGLPVIAPLAFVLGTLFVYWSGFSDLRLALPLTLVGVPLFVLLWRTDRTGSLVEELRRGAWLVAHLLVLTLLSGLGSFDGAGVLPAPWDTVVVAVWALTLFPVAVRSGLVGRDRGAGVLSEIDDGAPGQRGEDADHRDEGEEAAGRPG